MGGAKNLQLVTISNDNWEYLLRSSINITAEYIPSAMNIEGNRDKPGIQASGNWTPKSSWKNINPGVEEWGGEVVTGLFASRVSAQLQEWKPDTLSMDEIKSKKFSYVLLLFVLIGRVLKEMQQG